MPTKHIVFDELVLLWDANATVLAVATYYSADVDLLALGINAQSVKHYGVAISWPGVDSAGAAVTQLGMYSAATASPTAAICTFPTRTLAQTMAEYQDAERCVFPIPLILSLQYFRIGIIVTVADLTAGTITAGIIPLEQGG